MKTIQLDGEWEIQLKDGTIVTISDVLQHITTVRISKDVATVDVTVGKERNYIEVKTGAPLKTDWIPKK
ncbi:MAG: hypothetical protein Q7S12_03450 [bacterium]|nr:hypothetical protein [bacterium]